jgi:hypothetical protein
LRRAAVSTEMSQPVAGTQAPLGGCAASAQGDPDPTPPQKMCSCQVHTLLSPLKPVELPPPHPAAPASSKLPAAADLARPPARRCCCCCYFCFCVPTCFQPPPLTTTDSALQRSSMHAHPQQPSQDAGKGGKRGKGVKAGQLAGCLGGCSPRTPCAMAASTASRFHRFLGSNPIRTLSGSNSAALVSAHLPVKRTLPVAATKFTIPSQAASAVRTAVQRIVLTKSTSAPSEKRSATDFVNFVHSLSF